MAFTERPEPMNAITSHSKIKVSITVSDPTFVAGKYVSGKMEMECRADKGLGIGVIMIELFGIQELSSRDHSATSTFFHAKRLFQGPGLPPSNAVQAHSEPGDSLLPSHHYHARRGISTFLFRIPLPVTSPSSVNFGGGLASVKYELRASASVSWRGEKRLVTERKLVDVVEGLDDVSLAGYVRGNDAPSITVGENGKLWMQGTIVGGGIITAGESACVELQVKNHSTKKNTALTLTLTRHLVLPNVPVEKQPLQITDTLSNVVFRGPEYIIQPGVEGVANLVFDIPKTARGVKGGSYEDETELKTRVTPSIFEVQCIVSVKMGMGIGNKDLVLGIPVNIVSSLAIPHELIVQQVPQTDTGETVSYPGPHAYISYHPPSTSPPPPTLLPPMFAPYTDYNRIWFPSPPQSPLPFHYIPPINPLYCPPPPQDLQNFPPPRPASALASSYYHSTISGLPATAEHHPLLPLNLAAHYESALQQQWNVGDLEPQEGKGERASRVTHRLHVSSRHRSASPRSHRFPLPRSSPGRPIETTETPVYARTLPSVPFIYSPYHDTAAQPLDLSTSSPVHSPRPVLSPRVSHMPLCNERVEELERLAAEADEDDVVAQHSSTSRKRKKKGIRKGKEKEVMDVADINKTLPPPPVPTRKGFLTPPQHGSSSYPVVGVVQESPSLPTSLAGKAPPTPTLTAVTPVRHTRSNLTERLAAERSESGLDALEKRLLAEVGTKKIERLFSPPHAQHIFDDPSVANVPPVQASPTRGRLSPIKIPPPRIGKTADDDELKIDSAISSLTLADGGWALGAGRQERDGAEREAELRSPRNVFEEGTHDHELDGDSDEKTHRAGTVGGKSKSKSSLSGEDGQEEHWQKTRHRRQAAGGLLAGSELDTDDRADSRGRSGEGIGKGRKGGKKKEGHKRRKSVKGRVAAWLGAIDPDALPPEDDLLEGSFPAPAVVHQHSASLNQVQDVQPESGPMADVPASAPNPRSSGFMPIGTQKREVKRINPNTSIAENTGQPSISQALRNLPRATSTANTPEKPTSQSLDIKPPVVAKHWPTPDAQPQKTSASDDRGDKFQQRPKGRAIKTAVDELSKFPIPLSSRNQQSKKTDTQHDSLRPPLLPLSKPRSQDPEVNYDVKSARGGRGGQVTAITAFWAAAEAPKAEVSNLTKGPSIDNSLPKQTTPRANTKPLLRPWTSKPATPCTQPAPFARAMPPQLRGVNKASLATSEPSPKLLGIAGKSSAVSKSPVPAVVSSSLATPMLSTTASLVRPLAQQLKRPMMTAINSNTTSLAETPRSNGPVKAKSTPDLSFGKARLRDLIKKYQEQGS